MSSPTNTVRKAAGRALALLASLSVPSIVSAQSCALCYTQAAGSGERLVQALRSDGLALDTLSIGMSADLEAAIAEGSTMVRVGTAIFGHRPA